MATREQREAKELLEMFEGHLNATMEGHTLVLTTDTDVEYLVDPDGRHIVKSDGTLHDLCELETRADGHPFWTDNDSDERVDADPYAGPLTDEYTEGWFDRAAERKRVADDLAFYREQERRAA